MSRTEIEMADICMKEVIIEACVCVHHQSHHIIIESVSFLLVHHGCFPMRRLYEGSLGHRKIFFFIPLHSRTTPNGTAFLLFDTHHHNNRMGYGNVLLLLPQILCSYSSRDKKRCFATHGRVVLLGSASVRLWFIQVEKDVDRW